MICETCHGSGVVRKRERLIPGTDLVEVRVEPCPDCGGSGRAHCCEGERPGNEGV
jgi:DnaJ-class molecular chaperone